MTHKFISNTLGPFVLGAGLGNALMHLGSPLDMVLGLVIFAVGVYLSFFSNK